MNAASFAFALEALAECELLGVRGGCGKTRGHGDKSGRHDRVFHCPDDSPLSTITIVVQTRGRERLGACMT